MRVQNERLGVIGSTTPRRTAGDVFGVWEEIAGTAVSPAGELADPGVSADASVIDAATSGAEEGSDAAADALFDGSCSSRLMCSR